MNGPDTDLKQAVKVRDLRTVQYFVVDQQNLLLKDWTGDSLEDFRATLQASLQTAHRLKRQLVDVEDEIPYQLGIWEGCVQAFRAIYEEERKEADIVEQATAKSPNTAKIIRFLYQRNSPICHGDLADELGMTYSALTNAMKRVISCGAVSASKTGRNTRYTLTRAGQQYCRKEMTWEKVIPKNKETRLIEELIRLLQSKKEETPFPTSDTILLREDGKAPQRKRVNAIYQFEQETMLDLNSMNDEDPPRNQRLDVDGETTDVALFASAATLFDCLVRSNRYE